MKKLFIGLLCLGFFEAFAQEKIVLENGETLSFEVMGCAKDEIPKVSLENQTLKAGCSKAYCYMEADKNDPADSRRNQVFKIYRYDYGQYPGKKYEELVRLEIKYDSYWDTTKIPSERTERQVLAEFLKKTDECQEGLVMQGVSGVDRGMRHVTKD